jgi:hypothetical protein
MVWKIENSGFFESRFKKFQKKNPSEAVAVMTNLETYLQSLNLSKSPLAVKIGFLHHEPEGMKAIDQKGGGKNLMQTRLYVFPDVDTSILHVMSIGTKQNQGGDIGECRDYVRSIKKSKEVKEN